MKIKLIAIGHKMPNWVETGFAEYQKRLPQDCSLELTEIPALKRPKNADIERIMAQEAKAMLSKITTQDHCIALDKEGKIWNTEQLAEQLQNWQHSGNNIAILIGGPEGLHASCLERAKQQWSLSKLTFPHPLVRVILAEQLYRAWSVTCGHPYHK